MSQIFFLGGGINSCAAGEEITRFARKLKFYDSESYCALECDVMQLFGKTSVSISVESNASVFGVHYLPNEKITS
jgi:hypothetical protein